VSDRDPGLLAHLGTVGLVPGAAVEVLDVSPYNGTQTVRSSSGEQVIGADLARSIQVQPASAPTAIAGQTPVTGEPRA
jgi:Fe2+ transport system protein FeoA